MVLQQLRCLPDKESRMRSLIARSLQLGLITLLNGCGDADWQAKTYPAHGRITVNGEPPVGAVVELRSTGEIPDVRNSRPWAVVQDGGFYTLSTYETGDGAPAGDYRLIIKWPPDVSQPSFADRLKGAYANAERSPWSVTISAGDNELPSIALNDVQVQSKEDATAPRMAPPGPGISK
ncbi:MAG: hypothetical protein ACYC6N_27935 [Pirellulaceae bacterium]